MYARAYDFFFLEKSGTLISELESEAPFGSLTEMNSYAALAPSVVLSLLGASVGTTPVHHCVPG